MTRIYFDITLVNGLMVGRRREGKGDASCLGREMFLHYLLVRREPFTFTGRSGLPLHAQKVQEILGFSNFMCTT